jgi:hypothetical protein
MIPLAISPQCDSLLCTWYVPLSLRRTILYVAPSLQSYGWNFDERFKTRLSGITDNDDMTCVDIGQVQN